MTCLIIYSNLLILLLLKILHGLYVKFQLSKLIRHDGFDRNRTRFVKRGNGYTNHEATLILIKLDMV